MAKNPVLHLEGAEELNRALREIGGRAGGLILRKAAEAGAEVIAEEAQRNAPRDSGELAESIDVAAGQIQQGRAVMNIGVGKNEWYGIFSEFGTIHMPAKPFLRPALDTKAEEATEAVAQVLCEALRDVL
jgi:HK97 gp10 family phage protein